MPRGRYFSHIQISASQTGFTRNQKVPEMSPLSFSEIPLVVLEKVVCLLNGEDRVRVRLVSKAFQKACDGTTRFLTVKRSQWSGFPDLTRLDNCTVVLFLDDLATLPSFRLNRFEQPTNGSFLLVCGEWWWKRADLRQWMGQQKEEKVFKVGLMLCIMEQAQSDFDLCSMIEEVLDEEAPVLNYLGVWSQLVSFQILREQ